MIIRPIGVADRGRWEPLWQGYLDFYRAVLTPEVTEGTWAALCDATSAVHGLVAEQEDQLAGFAHLVLCPTTWATHPTCYLEDLYVAKQWRGGDVAHRLIEAVYAFVDGCGPRQRVLAHPGVQRPGTLPIRLPRTSDIVRRIPALSLPKFRALRPTPAAALG